MKPEVVRWAWRRLPASWKYQLRRRWSTGPIDSPLSAGQERSVVARLGRRRGAPSPRLWFLPTHTWFSSSFQRPQQMARALAEVGCDVVYWEPWEPQSHLHTAESDRERRFVGLRRMADRLQLLRCPGDTYVRLLTAVQPEWILFQWPYQARHIPPGCAARRSTR